MEKPVILCVDDENFILTGLKAQLRTQFGKEYTIETTESSIDALEIVQNIISSGTSLPIIISDHIMPDMLGDELLIKVHELSKSTLKIMLTGQADAEAIGNAMNKANLYRYITKPWEQNDLVITVKEALSRYQADRELEIKNEQLVRYNQELEIKIMERTKELQKKNKDLTDSINYAKRIQHAMLPFPERIAESLGEDYFILFKPKDIVSGDFYWFQDMNRESYDLGISNRASEKENKIVIVAADCTGHGVPGAFMSMIGNELLNQIVNVHHITSPELILNQLHKGIRYALQQGETENRDGMDISICVVDKEKQIVEYAGAMNPLYYVGSVETGLIEIKADAKSIGGLQGEEDRIFTKHTIQLPISNKQLSIEQHELIKDNKISNYSAIQQSTTFYLCSDGYQDQFGGEKNRKFMVRNLREKLFAISHLPMQEQKIVLEKIFDEWKGQNEQIDDVLIFGFKL